ncbi:MAG TPA: fumarylacetoacetate hydrolase family protein, partial [Thermomicrobiales bacterium]|nr:fumarylacetoacetate hydrolase family protein [Thermomicrobiales bacterium]
YRRDGQEHVGVIENGIVRETRGDIYGKLSIGPEIAPVDEAELLAPVVPSKLIAIGLNYQDHISQDAPGFQTPENPIVFLKPPSSLIGHGGKIVIPAGVERTDAEAELAVVIGRECRHVKAERAWDVILGLCPSNDVSARDFQFKDGQWSRAKGFDTFAPLGPAIVTDVTSDDLAITCRVNGEVKQQSSTKYLIFNVPYLIEFISRVMTLHPGDVIMTGTPAGPPQLTPGDVCEVEIEGLGILSNTCVAEEPLPA